MDITTLGIAMDTSDLKQGESALNSATDAANKAADAMDAVSSSASSAAGAASQVASAYTGLSQSAQTAVSSMSPYLAALKQEYDLLGMTRSETEAYIAASKNLSDSEQQMAAAIGAKIDAWNREEAASASAATAQDRMVAASQRFVDALQQQADMLGMTKAQAVAYQGQLQNLTDAQMQQAVALAEKIDKWNADAAAAKEAAAAEAQAAQATQQYLLSLQQEVDLLGASREQKAAYIANAKGMSDATQQAAASLGAQIDAYNEAAAAEKAEAQAKAQSVQAAQQYLASLQQEVALLGATSTQKEAYIAKEKGLSEAEQQAAVAMRAQVDAFNQAAAAERAEAAAKDQATKAAEGFIQRLQEQADAAGKTSAQILQMKAAQLGVSEQAAPLIAQIEAAGHSTEGFGLKTAAARREVIVLAHEMAMGNWSRFGGSMMVLGEQTDMLSKLMSPLGLAIGAVGAALGVTAAVSIHAAESMASYGDLVSKLSQQTGVSTDEIQKIGYAIQTVGGKSTDSGVALDTLAKKIGAAQEGSKQAQGIFQALGVSMSDIKNLSLDQVLGKIADAFSSTTDNAAKYTAAQELFGSAAADMIVLLDKGSAGLGELGAQAQQVGAVLDQSTIAKMVELDEHLKTSTANMSAMAMEAKTELLPTLIQITDAMSSNAGMKPLLHEFYSDVAAVAKGAATGLAAIVTAAREAGAGLSLVMNVANRAGAGDVSGVVSAWKNGLKEIEDAQSQYQSFIDKLWSNSSSQENEGLDFGSGQGWDSSIKLPQTHTSNRSAGLIDKTQLQGDIQAVKDALDQELSYVKSAQTQLDALYKSGGISEDAYYQQTRDNLAKTASAKIDAYNQDVSLLQKALGNSNLNAQQRAQISSQIQHDQALAAQATEDFFNAVGDSAAKAEEAWQKYGQSQIDAITKQTDSVNKTDQSLRDQIDTFGMTKSAIDDLVVSRTQDQLAAEQQGLAMAQLNGLSPDVIASYQKQIDALKELLKARQALAGDQATLDQLTAAKKVADQTVQDWKSAANSIQSGLTTALMNGFNNGKTFGQQLADTLKSLFKTLILQPIISPIAGSIAGMMYPGAAQAYAQTNPNSPLVSGLFGSLGSGGSTYGINNLLGSAASLFGGMSTGTATTVANAEGGDVLGNFLNLTGNGSSSPQMFSGSNLGDLGSILQAGGTGFAIGSMFGGTGSKVGGTIGGLAGSYIMPGVGTIIGSALGGLVGSLFGGGETRNGATYTTDGTTATKVGTGPSGGDPASEQVTSQINTTFQTIQSMATSLGGSIADLGTYHAGYEVSPKKGNSFVTAGFTTDPNQWDPGRVDLSGVKDSTTVLNDFSLQLQRSIITALQSANLDKPYADVLQGVDASTLSSSDITTLINELNTLKSLFDSIQTMGSDFDNLKNASTDAQLAVVNLSGGVTQFSTNASYFEQNFVPVAEQTANQAKSVTDQLAALGESSVTTNEQFRAAVQGIDLSTAAGQQLYAQMLALAPAFNTMTQAATAAQQAAEQATAAALQAAQQAADQQQSLWDSYYSALYTSDQQLVVSQGQLQAKFAALGVAMPKTNADFEALVENMDTTTQPMKDLQNALLALAPAFGQVTSSADQAAQAAAQAQQQTLQTALSNVQTAYTNQAQAIQANITSISQFITSLTSLKQSLALGSLSTLSPQEKYLQEKQLFEQTSASAASGDATAQGNLPQVAQDFLTASKAYNASSQAYVDDYNEVQTALDKNISTAQQQLSVAQQQLDATNQMVQGILNLNQTAMTLQQALDAYFAAGGTNSSESSSVGGGGGGGASLSPGGDASTPYVTPDWVKAAMGMTIGPDGKYGWYSSPAGSSTSGDSAGGSTSSGVPASSSTPSDSQTSAAQGQIESLYEQVLGRQADAGGLQFYVDQVNSGQKTLDQVKADLQYASLNGSHAGGADYIPFDGYRAELHKGEAVVTSANNQKLSQMLNIDWTKFGNNDNAALVSEIKSLRSEVAASRQSQQQIAAATLQQSQQQHAENRADMSKQTRQLQAVGDNTGKIANRPR